MFEKLVTGISIARKNPSQTHALFEHVTLNLFSREGEALYYYCTDHELIAEHNRMSDFTKNISDFVLAVRQNDKISNRNIWV